MGTPRNRCVSHNGPPQICAECRQPYMWAVVTPSGRKRKGPVKSLCPRCTRATKQAKRRKKNQD